VEFILPPPPPPTTATTADASSAASTAAVFPHRCDDGDDDDGHHNGAVVTPVNDDRHQRAFRTLMESHPDLPWNTKAMTRKRINPDISLKVEIRKGDATTSTKRMCSVKFHLVPLADVIAFEKKKPRGATTACDGH
jgi:hypothetical protein